VDGRGFVWGDSFETTYANVLNSRPGTPRASGVYEFPHDESVYGVRGLGGCRRSWCSSAYVAEDGTEDPAYRVLRGGAWNSRPYISRVASRFAGAPELAFSLAGLHLARSPG
jgi:serine/threonine-protein kinase